MTRRGGQAILVGVPKMDVMVNDPRVLRRRADGEDDQGAAGTGRATSTRDVPKLARLYSEGQLKLDELVSRTITLDEVNEAFDAMEKGEVARSVIVYLSRS